ncbi:nitroreductase family protein [Nitrosopumilus sp.]|uniref:nitroreductase family protein n=1 Tax=Nitrosopumilus sp. TaxID=2024843 RepID=UPI00344D1504
MGLSMPQHYTFGGTSLFHLALAQIAASGLGLSSIWIGMIDENKVKSILGTDLRPSSILCIGYPDKKKPLKSRRKLKELIEVIE